MGFDVPLWAFVPRSCARVQSCGGSRSCVAAGAPDKRNPILGLGDSDSSGRAHGFAQRKPKLPRSYPAAVLLRRWASAVSQKG